jgi:hypothetical protein
MQATDNVMKRKTGLVRPVFLLGRWAAFTAMAAGAESTRWSRFGRLIHPSKSLPARVREAGVNVYMQTAYQSGIDEILHGTDVSDRN